ncbi:hypothetical protein D928_02619 [Enterococcus faecalis 20-SD-BW-06]|nr:hypothetical protein D928_02619 [Enterococcus faecalis 20-SD-BW-06]
MSSAPLIVCYLRYYLPMQLFQDENNYILPILTESGYSQLIPD